MTDDHHLITLAAYAVAASAAADTAPPGCDDDAVMALADRHTIFMHALSNLSAKTTAGVRAKACAFQTLLREPLESDLLISFGTGLMQDIAALLA